MPRLRKARALPPGGTIGIAAPAGPVDARKLAAGVRRLEATGYRVRHRKALLSRRGYLAGSDARRARELMALVDDPRVDAIVCARGGYGCHRIIDALDAGRVRRAAKPLVGYSDITTLLLWQRRCAGLVGFHGPMLDRGGDLPADDLDALVQALGGAGEAAPLRGRGHGGGRAEGRLGGGSLSLVVASLGTPWEIDTRGAILLLEDVGERPYRLDRMLMQLRAAKKLDGIVGLGFGRFAECGDPRNPKPSAEEAVLDVTRSLGIPLVTELPFGHGPHNRTWAMGARAAIDGRRGEVTMLERGTVRR